LRLNKKTHSLLKKKKRHDTQYFGLGHYHCLPDGNDRLKRLLSARPKIGPRLLPGGNKTAPLPIALSTMATQCSTNSLLGAPAFVAFAAGGGLIWLQFELAVPFAMIVLMALVFPLLRGLNLISVYAYLENRFDARTRTLVSIFFQFVRAFSTSVTVYGISLVLMLCLNLPLWAVSPIRSLNPSIKSDIY
jgi:SSS family solute:Na+ symporter